MERLSFKHVSGESSKELYLGINLENEKTTKNSFQIYLVDFDRNDPDGEPVNAAIYTFVPVKILETEKSINAQVLVFKEWVSTTIEMCLKAGTHLHKINNSWANKSKDSRSSGRFFNNDDNSRDRDNDNDNQYRGKKVRRKPVSLSKNTRKDRDDELNEEGQTDDIPF